MRALSASLGSTLLLSLLGLVGCRSEPTPSATSSTNPEQTQASALSEFECGAEFPLHARCGDFEVFEDRAAGSGRKIKLRWVVLPATKAEERLPDPVFSFAGGPGQAATELTVLANTQLAGVNERRDLVFVDQRGTGNSNPLQCMASDLPGLIEGMTGEGQRGALAECRAGWDADLSHYGTTEAMADIDELRAALGYEQINIWGVSYGSRAAFEYLRRHESSVRSVLTWGIAPPQLPYLIPFGEATQSALDQLLADCALDPNCAQVLPGGLGSVDEVIARLKAQPARVELVDPRSGEAATIELDHELFMTGVRLTLYDASWASNLPLMLAAAQAENYRPLMDFVVSFVVAVYSHIYIGMNISVACSEDVARIGDADLSEAADTRSGARTMQEYIDTCADWPKSTLAPDWAEPVSSSVPVLLMNGAADPATPPSSAELAGGSLNNAKVVVFPKVGHGTSNAGECVNELIRTFIDQPDPAALDTSCVAATERPPFAF